MWSHAGARAAIMLNSEFGVMLAIEQKMRR